MICIFKMVEEKINNAQFNVGIYIRLSQEDDDKKYESDMINPDFVKIAQAYGILGYNISTKNELQQALKESFKYKKAVLLDIKIK